MLCSYTDMLKISHGTLLKVWVSPSHHGSYHFFLPNVWIDLFYNQFNLYLTTPLYVYIPSPLLPVCYSLQFFFHFHHSFITILSALYPPRWILIMSPKTSLWGTWLICLLPPLTLPRVASSPWWRRTPLAGSWGLRCTRSWWSKSLAELQGSQVTQVTQHTKKCPFVWFWS